MKTTETVKTVTYENGTRISTVERVVTRADDCEQLGNLYFRLSDIYRRLDACGTDAERAALEADKAVILTEIETYVGYLNGYEV
ncbi:MAG: hypothetical protein IJ302_01720 [Clostridia bacterium]|nr:hypothetical protein [Clostridia bacterium]